MYLRFVVGVCIAIIMIQTYISIYMILLFLMGVDLAGAFGILFLLTGLILAVFAMVRYGIKRIYSRFTEKRIFFLSLVGAWVLVPLTLVLVSLAIYLVGPQHDPTDSRLANTADRDNEFPDERTLLLDLEREAIRREFENDTTFLSSIMDTTFIELAGDRLKNKHQVLKTIFATNISNQNKGVALDSFRLEDPVVHLYDDNAAVVTFIMHTFRKKDGSSVERRTRFYDVWVRRGSQWKAVTWQASPVE